jgi:heme/copper-type cytochrome/quinol oxidase subunit 2
MPEISLAEGLFWLAAASCLVAHVAIIRSTIRSRGAAMSAQVTAEGVPVPRSNFPLELVWAVIPAVALGVVLWFTWERVAHGGNHDRPELHGHAVAELPHVVPPGR